jgi:hypothetical protein
VAEGPSDTPCSCWHRRGTGIPVCATAVVAFVVAFARGQQGPERSHPRLRPAHTAGVVIADRWVDDLESERWATTRGFESLRFRPFYQRKHRDSDQFPAERGRRWLHFWWQVSHKVTHLAARPTGWLQCAVDGSSAH